MKIRRSLPSALGACVALLWGFTALCATNAPPSWLQDHLAGRLKLAGVYQGVGFAEFKGKKPGYDTLRLAKDRALDDLCYQLSVSVTSEFENRLLKQGQYEQEQIASSLLVTSRKVLSGVTERQRYTDRRHHRHWVLLTIERSRADRQMQQQAFVQEVADRLERRQDEIRDGITRIEGLLDRQMALYSQQMAHYGRLLEAIDQKVGAADDDSRRQYQQIREGILRLEARQQAVDEQMHRQSSRQQQQIALLMQQNSQMQQMLLQLAGQVRQDYFLALASDDLKNSGQHPEFTVTIRPERGQAAVYRRGEKIRFRVEASRDCYIKVIYLSATDATSGGRKKMNTLLFPNLHDRENRIDAGRARIVGRFGELEVNPPYGTDIVTVMASLHQFADLADTLREGAGGFYTEVTDDTHQAIRMRSRGISAHRPGEDSPATDSREDPKPAKVASDTCLVISRP